MIINLGGRGSRPLAAPQKRDLRGRVLREATNAWRGKTGDFEGGVLTGEKSNQAIRKNQNQLLQKKKE